MGQEISNDGSGLAVACELMLEFARRTGLAAGAGPAVRYLWTDAFAVCNLLGLFQRTGDQAFKGQALSLIDQVHTVLGKHRDDDRRSGWISGLNDANAMQHPTAGGLRIGKARNERSADERVDNRAEWDRDGQYFHYLTKWMHALCQAARMTGELDYLKWSLELAKVAHARFTFASLSSGSLQMHWKMSIDLSRPLVASRGHHDPLDALVTYLELQLTSAQLASGRNLPELSSEVDDAIAMCTGEDWSTDDPLGLGGLLFDAYRLAQIGASHPAVCGEFLDAVLVSADAGLEAFLRNSGLRENAGFRLAFRELGLSIGLHALTKMNALPAERWRRLASGQRLRRQIADLQRFQSLRAAIEAFWLDSSNRRSASWIDHRDINTVMLASSLMPDGFVCLRPHLRTHEPAP